MFRQFHASRGFAFLRKISVPLGASLLLTIYREMAARREYWVMIRSAPGARVLQPA
jgi:hypothetical protein